MPKSLEQDISLNTAGYSKARARVSMDLVKHVFQASLIADVQNDYSHWQGYRVFIADGTYVQMQDTESIKADYEVKHQGEASKGYPQGLVEVLIDRGTGQIRDFKLANRHVSELSLFHQMIDHLPAKSLVLLDDLYNCYETMAKCERMDVRFVVPAKRVRSYELVEERGAGDEIIKISAPAQRSGWVDTPESTEALVLRRVTCTNKQGKAYILYSNVLDETVSKEELQALYLTRWDIEVSIREIKMLMDVNVLRSKSPEMALKELFVALIAYNIIRKIIWASLKDLPFPP